jgi:hypothetical protein
MGNASSDNGGGNDSSSSCGGGISSEAIDRCVNTITLDQLNRKYNIQFDTLVLDCEGAFYYILMDMPEILDNIKLIIMENDYLNFSEKQYIDDVLIKNNFYRDYVETGGWQPPTAASPPSVQQAQRGKAEQPGTRQATYAMFFAKVDASLGSSFDSPLPYTRFLPPESTAPAAAPATAAASAMGATARERCQCTRRGWSANTGCVGVAHRRRS